MTTSVLTKVEMLDLRGRADGQPHGRVGRVVVLDHAASLVDHWDTYLALANDREVAGVICLAIGEPSVSQGDNGTRSTVVLRVPAVLTQSGGAVLWVGDEQGVRWGSRANQPIPLRPGGGELTGLDRLVLALHVDEVFDEVRAQVQEMPGRVANPGLELFSGAVVSGQLVAALDGAIQELIRMRHDQAPTEALRNTIDDLARGPRPRPGSDPEGRVAKAANQATRARTRAADLARDAGSFKLFTGDKDQGGERPGPALGRLVERSGSTTAEYRESAATLLDRIDGQLRRGDTSVPKVVEMGVREPTAVQPDQVVDELSPAVARHLTEEPSLPTLARHLRRAAAVLEPAGCPTAADAARAGEPLERSLPKATQWPVSPVLLPLVLLTCAVATLVPSPAWLGWVVGLLAVIAWFVPAWLLLARWPQMEGELEPGEAIVPAVLSFGLFGIAGMVLGAVAARYLADVTALDVLGLLDVPTRWRVVLVVAVFAVIGLAVWSSWRLAARRLRKRLGTRELEQVHRDVSDLVDDVVGREWMPSARRRVVAAALNETADGLNEIKRRLDPDPDDVDPSRPLFTRPPNRYTPSALPGGVPDALAEEVHLVVRDDLLRIVHMALDPAWRTTRKGRRALAGEYVQRLDGLLKEYDDHVYNSGLMTLPRQVDERDPAPREAPRLDLLSRVWGDAPQARVTLRRGSLDDMTQLCSARQLGDLSTYGEPVMVRFAPAQVRQVLAGPGSRDAAAYASLVWTERAELAGVVRLLELQAGARESVTMGGRR